MAEDKIKLDVEVKGTEQSINSIKDLKKAIKDAKDEQLKMANAFGEGSKEFQKASKDLANLKDKVEDLNDSTQSLKGSGVEGLTSSFGMLGDGIKNFDFDKIKTGFKGIGSAMGAVPILLLVSGITMLMEKFDVFGKIADIVVEIFYALTDAMGITNHAAEQQTKAMIEGMDAQNKAVEQRYNNEIKLAKAAGKDTVSLEIDKLKSVENGTQAQLNALSELSVKKHGLNEDEKKQYAELQTKLTELTGERIAREVQAETDKNNKFAEMQKKFYDVTRSAADNLKKATQSDRQNEIDAINSTKDAQLKALSEVGSVVMNEHSFKERAKAEQNIHEASQIEIAKINAKYAKEAADKKKLDLQKQGSEQLAELRSQLEAQNLQSKLFSETLKAEQEAEDEVKNQAILTEMVKGFERTNFDLRTNEEIRNEYRKRDLESFKADKELQFELTQQGLKATQAVTDLFFSFKSSKLKKGSAEEIENARKAFQVNKAFNLASATMDGYKAVVSTYAQTKGGVIAKTVAASIAGLFAAVNIAKIASSKFESGASAPTVSAPSTPSVQTDSPTVNTPTANTNTSTTFNENGQVNGTGVFKTGNTQPTVIKAYVVESEMTDKQNTIKTIKNQSTF